MRFTPKGRLARTLAICSVFTIPGAWLMVLALPKNPGLNRAFVTVWGTCLLLVALVLPLLFTRRHCLILIRTLPSRDIRGEALAISISIATGSLGGFWLTSHTALIRLVGSFGLAIVVLLVAWLCLFGSTFYFYRLAALVSLWIARRLIQENEDPSN